MTLDVTVLQSDIDGERPLDKAIARAYGRPCRVATSRNRVALNDGAKDALDKLIYQYALPVEAKRFIDAFDRGETVQPISFQLKHPDTYDFWGNLIP